MDCCTSFKRIPDAFPILVKFQNHHKIFPKFHFFSNSSRKFTFSSQGILKICGGGVEGHNKRKVQQFVISSARADSSPCNFISIDTPLEPRSSAGKFLSNILQNHPHLFQFAVAEQLDELVAERDGAVARKDRSLGSPESCLHRRIAEMKEIECQVAVEDVMYMSIVHKFSDLRVPMVSNISTCINNGRLKILPSMEGTLESFHSLEVQEMIKEHLAAILGWRWRSHKTGNKITYQTNRLQLGRVYAASIMYGYFLKSASLRHQMESNLALNLPFVFSEAEVCSQGLKNIAFLDQSTDELSTLLCEESYSMKKIGNLKNYVMDFDSETLQRCAKLKSQEAVNLIEKHTWALFGGEKACEGETCGEIIVSNSSMKRLVLEAAAFGSFLWDVEEYVDSVYRLKDTYCVN